MRATLRQPAVRLRRLGLRLVPLRGPDRLGESLGVEITIDGRPLIDLVRDVEARFPKGPPGSYWPTSLLYLGLMRTRRNGTVTHDVPGYFQHPHALYLLVCACGEASCWCLTAEVTADAETVAWRRLRSTLGARCGGRYDALGPLVFDRRAYFREVARLAPAIGEALARQQARIPTRPPPRWP